MGSVVKRVLSQYISEYTMPNGVVGLLNSAFLTQAYVGEAAWRRLRQSGDLGELSSGERANLEHRRFLVAEGEDEQRLAQLRAARVRPFVEVMYLLVANTCNLGCRYCVVQKEHAQKTTGRLMSREVVDRALQLFLAGTRADEPAVLLWGGEPLGNWEVVKYAIERTRELEKQYGKQVKLSTVTNGTMLTQEIVNHLARNQVACSISVDGLSDQHDAMRVYPDGRGSFADVMRNVALLKRAGVDFGISLTIGAHNVDVLPTMARGLCRELETKHIGCSLLMNVDRAHPAYAAPERVAGQLVRLYQELCADNIRETTMARKVASFGFGEERLHHCGAGDGQIAVMPNGDIGICHYAAAEGKWIIGNVREPAEKLSCSSELTEWTRRSPVNMPQCQACPGLAMCGGGCPYEAHQTAGNLWALDERFCAHCKAAIQWMMEELFRARGTTETAGDAEWIYMTDVVARARFVRRFMPGLPETMLTATDQELQQLADGFRRDLGLASAAATQDWMASRGIALELFEEFLSGGLLLGRLEQRLAEVAG